MLQQTASDSEISDSIWNKRYNMLIKFDFWVGQNEEELISDSCSYRQQVD